MTNTNDYGYYEERQPDEWEEILKDVTVEKSSRETCCEPAYLTSLQNKDDLGSMIGEKDEVSEERSHQLDLVWKIAKKKLSGQERDCVLYVLRTGAGMIRVAKKFNISDDTVRRVLNRATYKIKQILSGDQHVCGEFPRKQGKRPPVRAAILPLDTIEEREAFQEFINKNQFIQIAYRGDDLFREALVIFITGKRAAKFAA